MLHLTFCGSIPYFRRNCFDIDHINQRARDPSVFVPDRHVVLAVAVILSDTDPNRMHLISNFQWKFMTLNLLCNFKGKCFRILFRVKFLEIPDIDRFGSFVIYNDIFNLHNKSHFSSSLPLHFYLFLLLFPHTRSN